MTLTTPAARPFYYGARDERVRRSRHAARSYTTPRHDDLRGDEIMSYIHSHTATGDAPRHMTIAISAGTRAFSTRSRHGRR